MSTQPADQPGARSRSSSCPRASTTRRISPKAASRPPSSCRSRSASRYSSRAKPASARPRSPRHWHPRSAPTSSASSATRASTPTGAVRVGLQRANSCTPACSRRDESCARRGRRDLRAPVPGRAVRCCKRCAARGPRRAADRRDRPGRRRVRGVPSRDALRLPGHRARAGDHPGERPPRVVLTSNRTRELHDALKRRCLYHWIDYPSLDREVEILARARAPFRRTSPGAWRRPSTHPHAYLVKAPGVAETIEWAKALAFLGVSQLDATPSMSRSGPSSRITTTSCAFGKTWTASSPMTDGARRWRHAGAACARRVRTGIAEPPASRSGRGRCSRSARGSPASTRPICANIDWSGAAAASSRTATISPCTTTRSPGTSSGTPPRASSPTPATRRLRTRATRAGSTCPPPVAGGERRPSAEDVGQAASDAELLRRKDFAECDPDELAAIGRLMTGLVVGTPTWKTRRTEREEGRPSGPAPRPAHVRQPRRRRRPHSACRPRVRPRPLVLLLDVSGSMSSYSCALLQFVYAVAAWSGSRRGVLLRERASPGSPARSPAVTPTKPCAGRPRPRRRLAGRDADRRVDP